MSDPYSGYGRPVSGADFVGRAKLIEHALGCLADGNMFLTGLHRVGKSSVAEEVLARLSRAGKATCRPINLNTVTTECELFRMMLMSLGSPEAKTLDRDDDFFAFEGAKAACERCMGERASRVVMVIDEFDGILSFKDPVRTLNRLRDFASYPSLYGINFLFVSSRSLSSIERKMAGSNLSGICKGVYLKPFDDEDAAAMVERCGLTGDDGFVRAVCEQTGGVPYLMAVLLSEFCSQAGRPVAELSAEERKVLLDKCIQTTSRTFLEYYEKVRHLLSDNDNAWGELIASVIGPRVKQSDPLLGSLLREYGILTADGESFSAFSAHFRDYLEMCSRDVAPFESLRSIEIGLRRIVNERLREELGESWADRIAFELPSVKEGLDAAREKLEKETRQFGLARTADLIEYTDLGDIKTIVTSARFWPSFQQSIGMGKADFTMHMDRILPMRNRTMHHRPVRLLPPEQVSLARKSCEALLARIK